MELEMLGGEKVEERDEAVEESILRIAWMAERVAPD